MKIVQRVETFDGELHTSTKCATKHLTGILGTEIAKHSHNLVGRKWSDIGDYLQNNIDEFAKLTRIKNDLTVEED